MRRKLLYPSESCFSDNVPYWVDLPWEEELEVREREGLLAIPYNYDCNGKFSFLVHLSKAFEADVCEKWEILYVARVHGNDISRVLEKYFRYVVSRRM